MKGQPNSLAFLSVFVVGCSLFGPTTVTRQVNGRRYEGPFISEETYAAYLRGALAAESQNYEEAETAFNEVTYRYAESAEAWTRLGAVRCARSIPRVRKAFAAFARAVDADATFAPAYLERARCSQRLGDKAGAWADVRRSVALNPNDRAAANLWLELRPKK